MSEPATTITAYPDGPLIVRGPAEFVGEDGRPVPRRRATVAVCRCGGSAIPPWCDGTHKALARGRRRARAKATDEEAPDLQGSRVDTTGPRCEGGNGALEKPGAEPHSP